MRLSSAFALISAAVPVVARDPRTFVINFSYQTQVDVSKDDRIPQSAGDVWDLQREVEKKNPVADVDSDRDTRGRSQNLPPTPHGERRPSTKSVTVGESEAGDGLENENSSQLDSGESEEEEDEVEKMFQGIKKDII